MDKLKTQFTRVGELLFSSNTGETYSKALSLTWNILKETAILLWMVFCLVFLVFVWGWGYATQISSNAKVWYDNQGKKGSENLLGDAGKALVAAGSSSAAFAVSQAKEQLGIHNDPTPIKPIEPLPANETVTTVASSASTVTETESKDS
ncbi:MAG: hypothetical protein J7641_11725 [Cyanobacteria bacterium SID2]|nr:hypothetical protein [Cyanobacteria bacterium SID2]MBP0004573.1 hypothetical protein [Cyanobacteria bacterium SBC]